MTYEPYPAPAAEPSAGWGPPVPNQPGGAYYPMPAGYGYPAPRTGSGGVTALSVVAGVLLIVSAVVSLVRLFVEGRTNASLMGAVIVPAVTSIIIAVLLFIPATRRLGLGVAIGYAFFAIPEILYIIPAFGSTDGKVAAVSAVLTSVAAIIAACGWRRAPRTGGRVVAVIGAAVTAVLSIVGLNLGWITAGFGFTCCPAYQDRSWSLAGDIFEFVILVGVLIWAVVSAPSRRSGGLLIGLGAGIGVTIVTTVLSFTSYGSFSLGAGLYIMVLGAIACVATAIAVLVRSGPSETYEPVVAPVPATMPAYGPPFGAGPVAVPGAMAVSVPQTNTMAILALVFAFVISPLGIVFGHIGRGQIRRTGEQGDGLALAGLILGYVFTAIGVLYVILVVVLLASIPGSTT